jgi:hypothetical protein
MIFAIILMILLLFLVLFHVVWIWRNTPTIPQREPTKEEILRVSGRLLEEWGPNIDYLLNCTPAQRSHLPYEFLSILYDEMGKG